MKPPADPRGLDLAWLGSDAKGKVAVFLTAGEGPIPASALASALGEPDLESQIHELPVSGACHLLVSVPNAESFTSLGSRGLFVFDWIDVHRSVVQATGVYELVCKPESPVALEALPAAIQAAALATPIAGASFENATELPIKPGT
jgi:hypothetical protein